VKSRYFYLLFFIFDPMNVTVPLRNRYGTTKTFPYYNWKEVRAFYIKKIESFNAGLTADYVKFLKELQ
jgi:Holliday junction resolvasome RuvABC ATP-dependent DNA helicase subunit